MIRLWIVNSRDALSGRRRCGFCDAAWSNSHYCTANLHEAERRLESWEDWNLPLTAEGLNKRPIECAYAYKRTFRENQL